MLTHDGPVRRGRPPRFDRAKALNEIIELFWHQGFDSTSLDQISSATGMHRPSLYHLFGSKEEIYCAALEAYLSAAKGRLAASLEVSGSLEKVLFRLFIGELAIFLHGRRGCFATITAAPIAATHSRVDAMLRAHAAWRQKSFVHRLTAASESNEPGKFVDLDSRAHLITMVLDALGVRSRLGERQDEMISVVRSTVWFACRSDHGRSKAGSDDCSC